MAQQLQSFTRRMMEGVVADHTRRTEHDRHCCELAAEYTTRLGTDTVAVSVPAPRSPKNEGRPLTEPMARYIRGLRRKVSLELLSPRHRDLLKMVLHGDEILFDDARLLIEAMKSLADQAPDTRFTEPSYIPEEGAYKVGDVFYLVVTSKETARRYAKKFDTESCKFRYIGQSPFSMLTADRRVTAEEAKIFADLYCTCCNCGLRLTKKKSKDYGYGPVCAERNGWPY